jgi:filamentous hemagglutinin
MAWVGQQTSLTSGESANINVGGKTTLTGAIIAAGEYDEQGNFIDNNNLTLTTKTLEYSDIKDINVSKSNGFGLSTSIGFGKEAGEKKEGESDQGKGTEKGEKGKAKLSLVGNTTISLKKTGEEKEQTNRATIGNGTIIVNDQKQTEQDLQGLNRDINNTQEITKEMITGALDGSVTLDNRLVGSIYTAIKEKDAAKLSVVEDINAIVGAIGEVIDKLKSKKNLTEGDKEAIEKLEEVSEKIEEMKEEEVLEGKKAEETESATETGTEESNTSVEKTEIEKAKEKIRSKRTNILGENRRANLRFAIEDFCF